MRLQHVVLKALAKKITWREAAETIGVTDRTMRRWRESWKSTAIRDWPIDGKGSELKARAVGRGGRNVAFVPGDLLRPEHQWSKPPGCFQRCCHHISKMLGT